MSRLIDQVGLTAGVGLTDRAGLYKFGTFDPLSLNPYAYFDGESYKGTLENPTLDLDPSNPDSLDVITATRAGTTATSINSSGLIQVAAENTVRVDHVQGEQLTPTKYQRVGYTDFSQGWTEQTVTSSSGGGYLGQPSRIVERVAGSTQALFYDYFSSSEFEANTNYTISFWIRSASGSLAAYADSYPAAVVSGNPFLSLTEEWQKVVLTINSASLTYFRFGVYLTPHHTSVGDAFEISQPQVEEGTTASSFVANTTGSPKFLSSAVYSDRVPMILCEPSATNLWSYSDLSNQIVSGSTFTTNYSDSPLGADTASQLKANGPTSSNSNIRFRTSSFTVASGESTISILAKADTRSKIYIHIEGFDGSNRGAKFDLLAGSVYQNNTGIISTIEPISGGWYRVSITFTTTTDLTGDFRVYIQNDSWTNNYVLDGTESVLFAGLQVESGSVATSYIPTSGGDAAARTRAADNLEIIGSDFDFYNASEGTFYQEVSTKRIDATDWYLSANDNTNNSALRFTRSSGTHRVTVAGQTEKSFSTAVVGQIHRLAMSHDSSASEFRASVDGVDSSPNPITGVTIPTNLTKLNIGSRYNGTAMCGHIKRVIFWPYSSENL